MQEKYPTATPPRKSDEKIEVIALACTKCGSPIKGPGPCQYCGQLLIIIEGGNYLRISPEDYAGIRIIPPTKSGTEELWYFKTKGGDLYMTQKQLWGIGNGNVVFGSHITALFFKKNLNKFGSPGQLLPTVPQIRRFALDYALEQAINLQSR